jgi:hypothetical protein
MGYRVRLVLLRLVRLIATPANSEFTSILLQFLPSVPEKELHEVLSNISSMIFNLLTILVLGVIFRSFY